MAAHRRPRPPYDAGPEAAALGATSMIDVSDGLLADLGHIAESSGVLINVETARLEFAPPVLAAARELRHDPLDWVLSGGEDHALAATFPRDAVLAPHWAVIGNVDPGRGIHVERGELSGRIRLAALPVTSVLLHRVSGWLRLDI